MTDYTKLVKALRETAAFTQTNEMLSKREQRLEILAFDAAAAIEALEAANKELSEELLEAQIEKPHWISAELPPKKPDKGVRAEFLVCLESGCVKTLLYEFGYSVPDGYAPLFDYGWHSTWSPVKYWMPLPEPPQEVQE